MQDSVVRFAFFFLLLLQLSKPGRDFIGIAGRKHSRTSRFQFTVTLQQFHQTASVTKRLRLPFLQLRESNRVRLSAALISVTSTWWPNGGMMNSVSASGGSRYACQTAHDAPSAKRRAPLERGWHFRGVMGVSSSRSPRGFTKRSKRRPRPEIHPARRRLSTRPAHPVEHARTARALRKW